MHFIAPYTLAKSLTQNFWASFCRHSTTTHVTVNLRLPTPQEEGCAPSWGEPSAKSAFGACFSFIAGGTREEMCVPS